MNKDYEQNWTIFLVVLCYDFGRWNIAASDKKIDKIQLICVRVECMP